MSSDKIPLEAHNRSLALQLDNMTERCKRYGDLLEAAWGIIANAGGSDWQRESSEWQKAAERWRNDYFKKEPQ